MIAVVVFYELLLPALPETHTERFGLFERALARPSFVRDAVDGNDRARPIRSALAMHEDGLVLRGINERHDFVNMLRARTPRARQRHIEITQTERACYLS